MHWMFLPYRRYAEFTGRSQRKEYWLFFLFYYAVLAVLAALTFAGLPWSEMMAADGGTPANTQPGPLFWTGMALIGVFLLVSLIPSIAVTVRRFHDQNLSGWLYLLGFIPYIGWLIVIVLMCIEGTRGPNAHGDDPKAANVGEVFA